MILFLDTEKMRDEFNLTLFQSIRNSETIDSYRDTLLLYNAILTRSLDISSKRELISKSVAISLEQITQMHQIQNSKSDIWNYFATETLEILVYVCCITSQEYLRLSSELKPKSWIVRALTTLKSKINPVSLNLPSDNSE